MSASAPLLLMDNESLLRVLSDGTFSFETISFDDAKGILETLGSHNLVRCFSNADIETIIYQHLGIDKQSYPYTETGEMLPGQNGLIFRTYVTESETSPIIKTEYGNEAKKIQNVYIYCEFVTRLAEEETSG